MKITLVSFFCSLAFALGAYGQTPTLPPDPAATAPALGSPATMTVPAAPVAMTPMPVATVAPVVAAVAPSVAPSTTRDADDDEDIDNAIEKKIRKHFNFTFDHDKGGSDSDVPWIAIPIVFIVFLAIFGTPVMIVVAILYFSFSRSRAMHKTVRMMVEKGQPVPEALLNPPPVTRQRSDLRRGVVLLMVGAGLMIFFGACNDWEGGAWSLGIIPFLIGLGYLLVWRLDVRRADDTSPKV